MSLRGRAARADGTGMVGTLAAVVVFLSFLLLAAHVLVGLYGRSVVNAAGYDAARAVASRRVDHDDPVAVAQAQAQAEERLRRLLGRMGDRAELSWRVDDDAVTLRLRLEVPSLTVPGLARSLGPTAIDRSFVVRVEDLR